MSPKGAIRRNGKTKTIMLFGKSIGHSLSPSYQNEWLAENELDAVYVPMEIPDNERFIQAIGSLTSSSSFCGANFTNPFKVTVTKIDALDPDDRVKQIGSANTLYRKHGKWTLTNTDVDGILKTIEVSKLFSKDEAFESVVLGAGGASAAAAYSLKSAYPQSKLRILCRDPERAHRSLLQVGIKVSALDDRNWWQETNDTKLLLINTLPLGQIGEDNPSARQILEWRCQVNPKSTFYFDMTYGDNPAIKMARDKGLSHCDGKLMLKTQAYMSFLFWKASLQAT